MSQKFPLDTCPTLKNGKTLCDIWHILNKYNLDPLVYENGMLSAEIALFIGLDDDNVTSEFKNFISKHPNPDY